MSYKRGEASKVTCSAYIAQKEFLLSTDWHFVLELKKEHLPEKVAFDIWNKETVW